MLEVVTLLLVSILLAFCVILGWKLYPFYQMFQDLGKTWKESKAEYGAEGGIASAAKRGSKNFLADLVKVAFRSFGGGLSDIALEAFPIIEEWMEKNPAAVIYSFSMLQNIPMVQGFLKGLTQGGGLQFPVLPQIQEGNIDNGEKAKTVWWQT